MLEVLKLSAEDTASAEKASSSKQGLKFGAGDKASADKGKAEKGKGDQAKDESRAVSLMVRSAIEGCTGVPRS